VLDGCLLIHKQAGVSSFGVIERLQGILRSQTGKKRKELPKFGHGGTLDPFATGLLLVCVGEGTKLSRYFLGSTKEYRGIIRFGETTLPGDPTEPISERSEVLPRDLAEIQNAAHSFCESLSGRPYFQTPPMHSAKKVDGKRLYELAREGKEIQREPVECLIEAFEISNYSSPTAHYLARVSAGTYIRVLGQDLGRKLGSVAMLNSLERTASGSFRLEDAMTLEEISKAAPTPDQWSTLSCFIPFEKVLLSFPTMELNSTEAERIRYGNTQQVALTASKLKSVFSSEKSVVLRDPNQKMTAIFSAHQGEFQLDRVFQSEPFPKQ
jgi:tRNA pseudouridine55 synthase